MDHSKKFLVAVYRQVTRFFGSLFDRRYLDPNVPIARIAGHANYLQYLTDVGNREGMKILEIGSREVTGKSLARSRFRSALRWF